MTLFDANAVIPYSSASNMARAYEDAAKMLVEARRLTEQAKELMKSAFQPSGESHWEEFDASLVTGTYSDQTEHVIEAWKLVAWRMLVNRLGVLKTMSSKRRAEFDKVCGYGNSDVEQRASKLPDITEDTIFSVLMGYCSSAEEFLDEAIQEEYDFWKCHSLRAELATNRKSLYRLDRKVIKSYMVSENGKGFRCDYDREKHLVALDNIFHLLDGKGCLNSGTKGPLVDAINGSDGSGETEYFRFKCYRNRNLHLEFRRIDLLDRFNLICGRNRLPG
jgi:hypothetical protein